jgi:hypothetical protein
VSRSFKSFSSKGETKMNRIPGILTLKAPVYKQVAEDTSATTTAAIIVVVMAILGGILGAIAVNLAGSSIPPDQLQQLGSPVKIAISTIINTIIGWIVGSAVFAFVAGLFGGKTNTGEMLRVFGFTQVFQVLNIIPCIGMVAALVLSVIGAIIGIREAGEFSTGKAVLTGIVGLIALFIVNAVVALVLGPILK